jgi:ATP-binding cassette subfamily B protein
VLLYKITQSKRLFKFKKSVSTALDLTTTYHISDPALGLLKYNEREFLDHWIGKDATNETEEGIALLLEPTPALYEQNTIEEDKKEFGFSILSS